MLSTIQYVDIRNQDQQPKISIVTTGTGVQSSAAPETGVYLLWWDVPCLLKINTTVGDTVTADTGLEMTAAGFLSFILERNMMITAKATTTNGTVRWIRVG